MTTSIRLYQRCHYAGRIWCIVLIGEGVVNLQSLDGMRFKRHVAINEISMIEDCADCYPEE